MNGCFIHYRSGNKVNGLNLRRIGFALPYLVFAVLATSACSKNDPVTAGYVSSSEKSVEDRIYDKKEAMDGACVTVCKHLTDCEVSKSGYDIPRTHEVYIDALNECILTCKKKVPASDWAYWLQVNCSEASSFPEKPGQG